VSYFRNPNTKCLICSKPIYRRPSELSKYNNHSFCSILCYGKFQRIEKPCIVCGKPILAGLNKITCSRSCSNKHRVGIKYKLSLPRKNKVINERQQKLRLISLKGSKCERCSYARTEILQVHHKDKDRNNNELGNLELICPNCHYEEHFLEKSWLKNFNLSEYHNKLLKTSIHI